MPHALPADGAPTPEAGGMDTGGKEQKSCTGAEEGRKMVRIKISYERQEELQAVLKSIRGMPVRIKVPKQQKGRFKRAYITIGPQTEHEEKIFQGRKIVVAPKMQRC